MEVDKILFENLRALGISSSFEELDIDGDGKIDKNDLQKTSDSKISSQIYTLLNSIDDESEIFTESSSVQKTENTDTKADTSLTKTSASNYCFNHINEKDFKNTLKNTKGTVYLILGNLGNCGHCDELEDAFKKNKSLLSELNSVATCYNMNWYDNESYCWSLIPDAAGTQFPIIAKFVDGKFVGTVKQSWKNNETSEQHQKRWIQKMISEAKTANSASAKDTTNTTGTTDETATKNTTTKTDTTNTTTTTSAAQTSSKSKADITAAVNDLLSKYKAAEPASGVDKYSANNPQVTALKQAIADGVLENLSKQGFSQDDIINIISQAFPTVGIKQNNSGGYTCPKGHGQEAKDIYSLFISELNKASSSELLALKNEIETLNAQILTNNAKLDALKAEIEILKKAVNTAIEEAIQESEEIAEEQKADAKKIVQEEIDKYSSSDGEMTYAQFQSALSNRLDDLAGSANSKLSIVISKMLYAERRMHVLGTYISQFSTLVNSNKSISDKIAVNKAEAEKIEEECKNSCPENVQRCDPIGFSANGVRYDFFVDKDNNGGLTNEKEFLGATGGWEEMKALDKDNDGKVTVAEMANVKIVMTAEDGIQTIKSVADVFAQGDTIDLNSYKSVGQDFSNGNTLLGTFSMTFNGQNIDDAYNTMDTLSWLDENYEFTDEENGIGRFAQGNTEYEKVTNYSDELTVFELDYQNMEIKLGSAWEKLGITRSNITEKISSSLEKEASNEASEIEKLFKKKAAEVTSEETSNEDCPECSVQIPDNE
ncbi:MAG: hypothetical protein K6A44_02330 [bacterium]|nr:hypothetical protein [bacterium]